MCRSRGLCVVVSWLGLVVFLGSATALGRDFRRGDTNTDGAVNISDPVHLLEYLFRGGIRPRCLDSADANDDGALNVDDALLLIGFLFQSGSPPPAPITCGPDATADDLGCAFYAPCPARVEPLPEFDDGLYSPYFATGELSRPRYLHEAFVTPTGLTIVLGGSDERGFSSIDSAEIFDQSAADPAGTRPESGTGLWIDTDFEGNPMLLRGGPRLYFTVDALPDGRLLIAGGTQDLAGSSVHESVEFFDPETRTFEALESRLLEPRFRHSSMVLPDGSIVFTGGQTEDFVTIIPDPPPIGGGRLDVITVFETTVNSEVYSPADGRFSDLTLFDRITLSRLASPRGRAGHAVSRIAGPDLRLGTPDDLMILAGGMQTLSGALAPQDKFPGAVSRRQADGLLTIECFDPATRAYLALSGIALRTARVHEPHLSNLGEFNDVAPDGTLGMGNLVLLSHGNTDAFCPQTMPGGLLLAATFTGFGPSQGLQLFAITEEVFSSHSQGAEYTGDPPGSVIGRSATNPVSLPRALRTAGESTHVGTWVVAVAGVHVEAAGEDCRFGLYGNRPRRLHLRSVLQCRSSRTRTLRAKSGHHPFAKQPARSRGRLADARRRYPDGRSERLRHHRPEPLGAHGVIFSGLGYEHPPPGCRRDPGHAGRPRSPGRGRRRIRRVLGGRRAGRAIGGNPGATRRQRLSTE